MYQLAITTLLHAEFCQNNNKTLLNRYTSEINRIRRIRIDHVRNFRNIDNS